MSTLPPAKSKWLRCPIHNCNFHAYARSLILLHLQRLEHNFTDQDIEDIKDGLYLPGWYENAVRDLAKHGAHPLPRSTWYVPSDQDEDDEKDEYEDDEEDGDEDEDEEMGGMGMRGMQAPPPPPAPPQLDLLDQITADQAAAQRQRQRQPQSQHPGLSQVPTHEQLNDQFARLPLSSQCNVVLAVLNAVSYDQPPSVRNRLLEELVPNHEEVFLGFEDMSPSDQRRIVNRLINVVSYDRPPSERQRLLGMLAVEEERLRVEAAETLVTMASGGGAARAGAQAGMSQQGFQGHGQGRGQAFSPSGFRDPRVPPFDPIRLPVLPLRPQNSHAAASSSTLAPFGPQGAFQPGTGLPGAAIRFQAAQAQAAQARAARAAQAAQNHQPSLSQPGSVGAEIRFQPAALASQYQSPFSQPRPYYRPQPGQPPAQAHPSVNFQSFPQQSEEARRFQAARLAAQQRADPNWFPPPPRAHPQVHPQVHPQIQPQILQQPQQQQQQQQQGARASRAEVSRDPDETESDEDMRD